MAGISSKALNNSPQNKYKFNDGNELQSSEFLDGSGLEIFDAVNRSYDPQLGRFWQVDELAEANWEWTPYNFSSNNPILRNDPLGLKDSVTFNGEDVNTAPSLRTVVIVGYTPTAKKNIYWQLVNSNSSFGAVENENLREWLYRYDGIQKFKERASNLQREQETIALDIGSFFAPMGWAAKIRYLKYAERLFNFKRGRIFWSGGRDVAGVVGENYAKLFGGHTLEMTLKGKYLEILQKVKGYDAIAPLWDKASREFAQGAEGVVKVFHNATDGISLTSTWVREEYKVLRKAKDVTLEFVDVFK